MTDLLLQIALSNVCISLALAIAAMVVEATAKRPALAHLLWLLVFVKLLTPPVFSIPVVTIPGLTDNTTVVIQDHSQIAPQISGNENDVSGSRETRTAILAQAKAVFSLIWLLGSVFVFAWSLVRVYRFNRLLGMESEVAPQESQTVAARIANRLRLKAVPTIYTTSAHLSPLVWWIGRKVRIVVPGVLLDQMDTRQFQWILAHVRRRDHLVRWIEWLACVCFWWNPLVWWGRHRLRANEELCCDALVVSSLKPRPHTYADSLLAVVECLACPPLRPPAVASEVNSGGLLERRFKMIVSGTPNRSNSRWLQAGVLLCAAAVLTLGLTYAQEVSTEAALDHDAVAKELRAAVAAGEITEEQAKAQWEAFKKRAFALDHNGVAKELKAAVAAGEMTEEQARAAIYREIRERMYARGSEGSQDDIRRRIEAAVESGERTREEADARYREIMYREIMERMSARGSEGSQDDIRRRIEAAVESGERTREEADARYREIMYREIMERMSARGSEGSQDDIRRRIEAAVEAGEMTEEQARARWEAYMEQEATEEK